MALQPEDLPDAIEQAAYEYAAFIERQSPAAIHRRPAPEEWTAAELTGHVAEFPVTFSAQAARLASGEAVTLGRALDDPDRLAAVRKLAGAGPAEAAALVREGARRAAITLRAIPPEAWQAHGHHPVRGLITVADIARLFILDHLREHLGQAHAAVGG